VWDLLKKIKYKNRVLFVMLAKNMNNNNKWIFKNKKTETKRIFKIHSKSKI
jgi:hypothetical protein